MRHKLPRTNHRFQVSLHLLRLIQRQAYTNLTVSGVGLLMDQKALTVTLLRH